MKPNPQPDWIPRKLIRAAIRKRTGTLVSERRIGGWIARGELTMLKAPSGRGHAWFTTKKWLDELIRRYS